MQTLVLSSNSKSDLALIVQLAKKIGVNIKELSEKEVEDYGLLLAMEKGKTGKYVDTEAFLQELKK